MKKRAFTVVIVAVMACLLLALCGCSKYNSNYSATGLVQTSTEKSASMSFSSFKGTIVFKLKCESADEKIHYSAKLESGSAAVYYDSNGEKTELFSVNSGDDINEVGGVLQEGTVYIIVEMSESGKNGQFSFDVN